MSGYPGEGEYSDDDTMNSHFYDPEAHREWLESGAEGQDAATRSTLQLIADIAEGSTTANSLPHIAKIARRAIDSKASDERTERLAFEKWVAASGRGHLLEREAPHKWYKDPTVTAWWTAWQARATL